METHNGCMISYSQRLGIIRQLALTDPELAIRDEELV